MKKILSLVLAVALLVVAGAPVIVGSVALGGLAQAQPHPDPSPPPHPNPPGPCPGESPPPCDPPPG
jgi:hypothetical protein